MNKEQAITLQRQLQVILPLEIEVILSIGWKHIKNGPDEEDCIVGLWMEGELMTVVNGKDMEKFRRFCKLVAFDEQTRPLSSDWFRPGNLLDLSKEPEGTVEVVDLEEDEQEKPLKVKPSDWIFSGIGPNLYRRGLPVEVTDSKEEEIIRQVFPEKFEEEIPNTPQEDALEAKLM